MIEQPNLARSYFKGVFFKVPARNVCYMGKYMHVSSYIVSCQQVMCVHIIMQVCCLHAWLTKLYSLMFTIILLI